MWTLVMSSAIWNLASSILAPGASPQYQSVGIGTGKPQAMQLAKQGHRYTYQQAGCPDSANLGHSPVQQKVQDPVLKQRA